MERSAPKVRTEAGAATQAARSDGARSGSPLGSPDSPEDEEDPR